MALTPDDLNNINNIVNNIVTKALASLATKDELHEAVAGLATRQELSVMATKHDLDRMESRLTTAINLPRRS